MRWWLVLAAAFLWASLAHATTQIYQIHNAPGWVSGTSYSTGSRVNSGPGNSGGTLTSGLELDAFQVTGAGGGGSTAAPTTSNCATTCTLADGYSWKWLSLTHYVTLFDAVNDTPLWAGTTTYSNGESLWVPSISQFVVVSSNNGSIGGCSAGTCNCTSSSSPPTWTSTPIPVDGTCSWVRASAVTIGYSYCRGASTPCGIENASVSNATYPNWGYNAAFDVYRFELWNDREYNPTNGEQCAEGRVFPVNQGTGTEQPFLNNNSFLWYDVAAGESFVDVAPRALYYSQANGVGIYCPTTNTLDTIGGAPGAPDEDGNYDRIARLQVKSGTGAAINRGAFAGAQNIFQGAKPSWIDIKAQIQNSAFIVTEGAQVGFAFKYGAQFTNNTVVCPTADCKIGLLIQGWVNSSDELVLRNNVVMGFTYPIGYSTCGDGHASIVQGTGTDYNATDAASSVGGNSVTLTMAGVALGTGAGAYGSGCDISDSGSFGSNPTSEVFAGSHDLYSVAFSAGSGAKFTNATNDFRINSGSSLIGGGAQTTVLASCPWQGSGSCGWGTAYFLTATDYSTPDIFGTSRGSGYDIGAMQFVSAPLATMPLGGIVP